MELKDLFKKVGSDPCLVLDFDAAVRLDDSEIIVETPLAENLNSADEAYAFCNAFTTLLENATKTKSVTLRTTIKETDAYTTALLNGVFVANTFLFADATYYRDFSTTSVVYFGLNFHNYITTLNVGNVGDTYYVHLVGKMNIA